MLFFEAGDTQSEGCTFSEKETFQTLIHLCAFDFAFITFVFVRMQHGIWIKEFFIPERR